MSLAFDQSLEFQIIPISPFGWCIGAYLSIYLSEYVTMDLTD
jgi:hypothetical protein